VNNDLPLDHFDLSPDAVRSQFRSAQRRGTPLWLWPNTPIEAWKTALQQIGQAARVILTGSGRPSLAGTAEDIGIAAFTSGMGPLLGYWAEWDLLDAEPPVRSILQLHYRHNCQRMERLARHATEAVKALAAEGVGVTVLKGMHTAYSYFPEPTTRPVSDIDLLIEPSDKRAAAGVLGGLGYLPDAAAASREQSWYMSDAPTVPRSLSLTHQDNPWNIDLHTSLDRRYSPGAPMIALDRALGKRAREPWQLAPQGYALPPNELVLHLAVHASVPFVSLTMIRLIELVLVIESVKGDRSRFWDRFLTLAEETGAASSAYPALHFANNLVEGTVPEAVLQILERQVPAAARRVIGRLTPATCQRMQRYSLEERFMWTTTFQGWMREVLRDLIPTAEPRELLRIYTWRFWVLARRSVTR
jgi:hypothetical protein